MPISTSDYLIKKEGLLKSISWYVETISEVERQQTIRKNQLTELKSDLFKLEKEFYTNG